MVTSDLAEVASGLGDAARIGGLLGEATRYHLASGGTAWRAQLAIECGHALGVRRVDCILLAVACELVHQASVVQDDAQDKAPLRRGQESAAAKFGAATAVCVGDHLLVSAFAQLAALPRSPDLIRLFGHGIGQMAAAQAEEFNPALWSTMTQLRYEALIGGKSGAMVVLPVAGAALLAGLPAAEVAHLTAAAQALGIAYQAGDDVQDLVTDLISGSLNGVVVRGLVGAGEAGRPRWLDLLARARLGKLPAKEALAVAEALKTERALTLDWSLALLSNAAAGLSAQASRRCSPLVSVIDQAADMLASRMARDRKSLYAA
ncbi:MAG: polyprenyl synthetase family protein [Janthinobacterium lividum]